MIVFIARVHASLTILAKATQKVETDASGLSASSPACEATAKGAPGGGDKEPEPAAVLSCAEDAGGCESSCTMGTGAVMGLKLAEVVCTGADLLSG